MKAFVNCVKVELNLANDVVYHNLITIDITYCPAQVKNMAAQFSLTLF